MLYLLKNFSILRLECSKLRDVLAWMYSLLNDSTSRPGFQVLCGLLGLVQTWVMSGYLNYPKKPVALNRNCRITDETLKSRLRFGFKNLKRTARMNRMKLTCLFSISMVAAVFANAFGQVMTGPCTVYRFPAYWNTIVCDSIIIRNFQCGCLGAVRIIPQASNCDKTNSIPCSLINVEEDITFEATGSCFYAWSPPIGMFPPMPLGCRGSCTQDLTSRWANWRSPVKDTSCD